jgi:proline iminopeptidase
MRLVVNDTELYVDIEGAALAPEGSGMRERPTIILLHGGPGFDHTCFKPFLSPLAETAQLVYVDLRGQGRSGRPPLETCVPARMADDIAQLCLQLGIVRPAVFGHSFGGFVALHLALRHPEAVGQLILANTAGSVEDMAGGLALLEERYGAATRAAAERLFRGDFSLDAQAEFGRLAWPTYVSDPAKVPALMELMARTTLNFDVAAYYFQHVHPTYDLRPELGRIQAPTLVITGEDDWVVHPQASRVLASRIPRAELLISPRTRHMSFVDRPDLVLSAVQWLLGAGAPAGAGGL